jgi:hypothetical protein
MDYGFYFTVFFVNSFFKGLIVPTASEIRLGFFKFVFYGQWTRIFERFGGSFVHTRV